MDKKSNIVNGTHTWDTCLKNQVIITSSHSDYEEKLAYFEKEVMNYPRMLDIAELSWAYKYAQHSAMRSLMYQLYCETKQPELKEFNFLIMGTTEEHADNTKHDANLSVGIIYIEIINQLAVECRNPKFNI
ncbi:hypothetical protein BB561_006067 [Smittium simulii]|uniref:Uncharacterized protein n=1 Tax=Smittium simulii TaxID=133385 RepID=A0A2T9Y6M7_9FUNG|nr:hypothetical protein BB561_006067 [Smittium simulii]